MEVIIKPSAAAAANVAADIVAYTVGRKPEAVLGVATGSSPLGVYQALGDRVRAGRLTFREARAFMLDEYVGLPDGHPQRYRNVVERDFVSQVDIASEHVLGPDGLAADIPQACAEYEAAITDAGGVDVQILGIGTDGHIAFNEPGCSLASRTRIKTLTHQTRLDNARFFENDIDQVPLHCLTQGIGTIMAARHLLLVASGLGKAEAIHHMVEGPITAMWPASVAQLHPRVTVVLDTAAASRLQLASYFMDTYEHRPAWQHPWVEAATA